MDRYAGDGVAIDPELAGNTSCLQGHQNGNVAAFSFANDQVNANRQLALIYRYGAQKRGSLWSNC